MSSSCPPNSLRRAGGALVLRSVLFRPGSHQWPGVAESVNQKQPCERRALSALGEDRVLLPAPVSGWLTAASHSGSRGRKSRFWSPLAPSFHTHTETKINIFKREKSFAATQRFRVRTLFAVVLVRALCTLTMPRTTELYA